MVLLIPRALFILFRCCPPHMLFYIQLGVFTGHADHMTNLTILVIFINTSVIFPVKFSSFDMSFYQHLCKIILFAPQGGTEEQQSL